MCGGGGVCVGEGVCECGVCVCGGRRVCVCGGVEGVCVCGEGCVVEGVYELLIVVYRVSS